jgi:hypothetical protein
MRAATGELLVVFILQARGLLVKLTFMLQT